MPTAIPHLSSLIRREDVWNFAEIEDVVDILQEQLILELVVVEEEHPAGDVRAELLQDPLQVVPPVFETGSCSMNLTFIQTQPRLILIIICDYQHVYLYELLISIIWKLWEEMWAASRVRHWRPEHKKQ